MSVRIEIRIDPPNGIRDFIRRMGELLRLVENQEEMFVRVGTELDRRIQQGFDNETDPYGNRWPKSHRARCTTGGKTLTDTGRLRNSIVAFADRTGLIMRTNNPYAATHQLGATIRARRKPYLVFRVCGQWVRKKEVTIPARPFMPDARGIPLTWRSVIDSEIGRKVDADIGAAFD